MGPRIRDVLRVLGSLRIGVVLLAVLMVAMGSATVYESRHGTEQALAAFYQASWFQIALALLGVNILAAVMARLPLSRGQTGFALTHGGILVILAGAWITDRWGVNGSMAIAEGETADVFQVPGDTLTAVSGEGGVRATMALDSRVFRGFVAVNDPETESLQCDAGASVDVLRYVPDLIEKEEVWNDNPDPNLAVEVALSSSKGTESAWVRPDHRVRLGALSATVRVVENREDLDRLVAFDGRHPPSHGTVRVKVQDAAFEFQVEECGEEAVLLGETGRTIRVVRYLPHAVIGTDGRIANASAQPMNPAIEVEIGGPDGVERQPVFARFPALGAVHPAPRGDIDIVFVSSVPPMPQDPVEVLSGPDGELYVRFSWEGTGISTRAVDLDEPVATPWPGKTFTVRKRIAHARIASVPVPLETARIRRTPAVLVRLAAGEEARELWLRKNETAVGEVGGRRYELRFGDKEVPLGFEILLSRFQVVFYPGGETPRSFESHVSLDDSSPSGEQMRVIRMNHPIEHGGYTFFQSSYRRQGGRLVSILQVTRDPGQAVTFAGYGATAVGMLAVLGLRIRQRGRGAGGRRANAEREGVQCRRGRSSC
ncbi:MAG: cytochrome c biogenesis protein ResB [Planctomycetota bacterium]